MNQKTVISYQLSVISKDLKLITDYRLPITMYYGIILLLFVSIPAYGLLNLSGSGEGVSRNYSMLSRGYDAVEWNPANLCVGPKISFNLFTIGLEYNSNLHYTDFIDLCFSGRFYDEEDKKIFKSGTYTDLWAGAQAISLSWSNFAATTYLFTRKELNIPEDVAQLILYGNMIEKDTVYLLDGIEGESEIRLVVGLSAAKLMPPTEEERVFRLIGENVGAGATFKYFQGFSYDGIVESEGKLITTMDAIQGDGKIIYRSAEGGAGWGIDLGLLYFTELFSIGVSVVNFASAMVWNKNPQTVEVNFKILDSTRIENFDPDTSFVTETIEEKDKSFTTHEQPITHVGIVVKAGETAILLDGGYPQLFGVGFEQKPLKFLSLRAGISYKDSNLWYGGGIGLNMKALHLDLGFRINSLSKCSTALSMSIIPE